MLDTAGESLLSQAVSNIHTYLLNANHEKFAASEFRMACLNSNSQLPHPAGESLLSKGIVIVIIHLLNQLNPP